MPIYDYDCAACGRRFEVIHGVHAEGPSVCELCGGGPVRKAVTAAAVHYRGSGWAKKERRSAGASKAATEGSSSDAAGSDGASSDGAGSDRPSSDRAEGESPKGGDKGAADRDTPKKASDTGPGASDPPPKSPAEAPAPASTKRTD
jgi:putative FmdB family regulatory protein